MIVIKKGNAFINANTGNPLTLSISQKKEMEKVFEFAALYLVENENQFFLKEVNSENYKLVCKMAEELNLSMYRGDASNDKYRVFVVPRGVAGLTPITIFYNK